MRWLRLSAYVLVIGSAVAEIIFVALGAKMSRFDMVTWPALVLAWSLIALTKDRTLALKNKTIEFHQATIRNQAELLTRILSKEG